MSNANLNISVIEKRMLKQADAAIYTGLALKHFKATCPVQPVELRPGTLTYDKRDLDTWIDGVKTGVEATTQAEIVGKI